MAHQMACDERACLDGVNHQNALWHCTGLHLRGLGFVPHLSQLLRGLPPVRLSFIASALSILSQVVPTSSINSTKYGCHKPSSGMSIQFPSPRIFGTWMLQRGSVSQLGKLMRRVFLTALAGSCCGSQLEAGQRWNIWEKHDAFLGRGCCSIILYVDNEWKWHFTLPP